MFNVECLKFKEIKIMRNEVNRAHKAKTTLRYLLILIGLVSVLSVQAQGIAQMPTTPFRSTSTMVGSGSTLPVAAHTGVRVTGTKVGTYADASYASQSSRPRRIGGNTEGGSGDREDPYKDPIGDAMLPLMLMAMLFAGVIAVRKKRVVKVNG